MIEKYLSKYKFNPERKELEGILKGYFTDYIYGQDNTPVTDFTEERKLLPEVKKSYNNFLKFNKNSTYYKQMKNLYDLYKSNGFVRNDKVDDYIQSIENRN